MVAPPEVHSAIVSHTALTEDPPSQQLPPPLSPRHSLTSCRDSRALAMLLRPSRCTAAATSACLSIRARTLRERARLQAGARGGGSRTFTCQLATASFNRLDYAYKDLAHHQRPLQQLTTLRRPTLRCRATTRGKLATSGPE